MKQIVVILAVIGFLAGLTLFIKDNHKSISTEFKLESEQEVQFQKAAIKTKRNQVATALQSKLLKDVILELNEEQERKAMIFVDSELSLELQVQGFIEHLSERLGKDVLDSRNSLIRSAATEMFLRLDAIQEHLAEMPSTERFYSLDQIRKGFGYSSEDRQRLSAIDRYKEAKWVNGEEYMEARDELIAQELDSKALAAALAQLRVQFFGVDAPTIQVEEDEGFFRFNRPRVYGKN